MDAERSTLREHHERLRALADAEREATLRAADVEDALQRLRGTQAHHSGMRDRLRTTEQQARLLLADVRTRATEAAGAVDAARFRTLATEQRLLDVRALIDGLPHQDGPLLEGIRRPATLPTSVSTFPSIAAFIEDRPERAQGHRRIEDLIGRPLGDRWILEEEDEPWISSRWRVAWACDGDAATGELYAVELVLRAHPTRRVHLLGTAAAVPGNAHLVESALGRQGERNSLAALAAVAATLR